MTAGRPECHGGITRGITDRGVFPWFEAFVVVEEATVLWAGLHKGGKFKQRGSTFPVTRPRRGRRAALRLQPAKGETGSLCVGGTIKRSHSSLNVIDFREASGALYSIRMTVNIVALFSGWPPSLRQAERRCFSFVFDATQGAPARGDLQRLWRGHKARLRGNIYPVTLQIESLTEKWRNVCLFEGR